MSSTQIKAVIDSLMSDEALKQQLATVMDEEQFVQQMTAAARSKGHEVTADAVREGLLHPATASELSDSDLQAVSGGGLGKFLEQWYYERFTSGLVKC